MKYRCLSVVAACLGLTAALPAQPAPQPVLGTRSVPLLRVDGLSFKDLNRNGRLDAFEDWRNPPEVRTHDLLARMATADLVGLMLHGTLPAGSGAAASIGVGAGGYDLQKVKGFVVDGRITTFISRLSGSATFLAEQSNALQAVAEGGPFAIPLTISTDPRNGFQYVQGASVQPGDFSKWPDFTGMAAIGDPAVTRRYADTVRQEYLAVGINEALSPQADLATEPRWARLNGTFGEDPDVARAQVKAYVEGMQHGGNGLVPGSVLAVVKHWVGYGAQQDGWDSHNFYGRFSAMTDAHLQEHITPFLGAFEAHVGSVMPTYSILKNVSIYGKLLEPVGAGYSAPLLGLLRKTYHFDGAVVSDWQIGSDCTENCRDGVPAGQTPGVADIAMPWGVENLTKEQRFAKMINAGVDQIGGSDDVATLTRAVNDGAIPMDRVRQAASRILLQKFQMGLFENAFVDVRLAGQVVGNEAFVRAGVAAQERSLVLLENKGDLLPVRQTGRKVWLFGVDAAVARAHGFVVVDTPEQADFAIIRAETPWERLHPGYFFGLRQHEGRLDFRAGDASFDALRRCGKLPVVFTVYLDRPAVLTNVKDRVAVLLGNFGISDDALLEVVTGKAAPGGTLPFELPRSMAAVSVQKSDAPHDSERPLYPYGFGLKR